MLVPVQDMTFVLRTAGERTAAVAEALLRELVAEAGGDPGAQVAVIAERPFSAAVRRTFELGLDARRPWVIGLDADVLLLRDAIDRFGMLCATADGGTFNVVCLVLCKFYGGFCFKGMHCYPRRLLDRALRIAQSGENAADLRPETAVARIMASQGFGGFGPPVVMGVHDYEQHFHHVYVKMRLRARRGVEDERAGKGAFFEGELAFVQGVADRDPDFEVARWGLMDGRDDALSGSAPSHYVWTAKYPELEARMREAGLGEKAGWLERTPGIAERCIAAHDFARDLRTPAWVRERFGFERGTSHALRRIGVSPITRPVQEAAHP